MPYRYLLSTVFWLSLSTVDAWTDRLAALLQRTASRRPMAKGQHSGEAADTDQERLRQRGRRIDSRVTDG